MRRAHRVGHPGTELLGSGSAGRLAGGSWLDFEREALAVGIDRRERAGAVGFGGGAVGVFGVAGGLLGEVSGEGGNGLLTLENGDLDVGSGAFPRYGVLAGVDRLAFDIDLFIELERALVGISGESGRREQQSGAENSERDFREFHEILISFQISADTLRRTTDALPAGEFQFAELLDWTLQGNTRYGKMDANNEKE